MNEYAPGAYRRRSLVETPLDPAVAQIQKAFEEFVKLLEMQNEVKKLPNSNLKSRLLNEITQLLQQEGTVFSRERRPVSNNVSSMPPSEKKEATDLTPEQEEIFQQQQKLAKKNRI